MANILQFLFCPWVQFLYEDPNSGADDAQEDVVCMNASAVYHTVG